MHTFKRVLKARARPSPHIYYLICRVMRAGPETFARRTIDAVEALLSRAAQEFVRGLAAARKIQPLHLALAVPGLCHAHNPCTFLADDCAFCRRAGNVFVPGPVWRRPPTAPATS